MLLFQPRSEACAVAAGSVAAAKSLGNHRSASVAPSGPRRGRGEICLCSAASADAPGLAAPANESRSAPVSLANNGAMPAMPLGTALRSAHRPANEEKERGTPAGHMPARRVSVSHGLLVRESYAAPLAVARSWASYGAGTTHKRVRNQVREQLHTSRRRQPLTGGGDPASFHGHGRGEDDWASRDAHAARTRASAASASASAPVPV